MALRYALLGLRYLSSFEGDIKIMAQRNLYQIVHLIYKDRLNNLLSKMFYSKDKDVCKMGASYICNLNIWQGNFNELIFSEGEFNTQQKKGII